MFPKIIWATRTKLSFLERKLLCFKAPLVWTTLHPCSFTRTIIALPLLKGSYTKCLLFSILPTQQQEPISFPDSLTPARLCYSVFQKYPSSLPLSPILLTIFHHNNETSSTLRGPRIVSRSLFIRLVQIFHTKELKQKIFISLLSLREYLRWIIEADTASLQQFVSALKIMMYSTRTRKLATFLTAIYHLVLRKAGTERACQAQRASQRCNSMQLVHVYCSVIHYTVPLKVLYPSLLL